MKQELIYGSEKIEYTLLLTDRKTLGISVHPDRSVEVKAPMGSTIEKVTQKIRKKAPWILKQKDHFLSFEPRTVPKRHVSGETHLYLGRQYQLKVIPSLENRVKYTGRFIEVYTSDTNEVKLQLSVWYREKAKQWFHKLTSQIKERFLKYGVAPKAIEINEMEYRWGSCSNSGRILLNPELVKAPKACIEYVIVHEFCHLVHRDHTKAFFDLQKKEMPDWLKWKNKLENLLA